MSLERPGFMEIKRHRPAGIQSRRDKAELVGIRGIE